MFTDGTDPRDSGLVDRDAWIAYLQQSSPVSPSFDRSRVVVDEVPGTVTAGSDVSVGLSGLNLTSLGSPTNTSVDGYLVAADATFDPANPGTAAGTATVTGGAATLTATVPADAAAGEYDLWVVASPSGTTARIPVTVEAAAPTVELVNLEATARCTGKFVHLAVRATNGEDAPVEVVLPTPYGSKGWPNLQPG